MNSENCQTSKTEKSLGNSQWFNSASRFRKKLPLRCLKEPQVRKIGDITDNKGTSKLTRRHIKKSVKYSRRRSSRSSQRLKSDKLTQKLHLRHLTRFWICLWTIYIYQLNSFRGTEVPCLFNVGLFCLMNKDSDTFLLNFLLQ